MRLISFTNTQLLYAAVDDEDYDFLRSFTWHCHIHQMVPTARYKGTTTSMARILLRPPDGYVVDHINRVTLDNQRCNLRICTVKQNSQNKAGKGVTKTRTGKFKAAVGFEYKRYYLGTYDTYKEAREAYIKARQYLFGEYA